MHNKIHGNPVLSGDHLKKEMNTLCPYITDIREAIKMAVEITGRDEVIIFAGSLYMIGEVKKILKNKILP